MNIQIREERPEDHKAVFELIEKAFESEELSDHREQFLVERLRLSDAFIPELSLVYEQDGVVVGYILLTKLKIVNATDTYESLALAPVAVLPAYQGKGIGGALITEAHKRAKGLGYKSVVLLGHADYYPKFGYKQTKYYNISLPFDVPDENCMACELIPDGLKGINGIVEYPQAFME